MTDSALVPVEVGACRCPGAPHPDGDIVYLRPKLDLHGGMVAQRKIIDLNTEAADLDHDEVMATLAEVFCRYGVADWTFSTEDGKAVTVTPASIQSYLLDDFAVGYQVAEQAAELYTSLLLDPLLGKASKSSRPTPINGSTSARTSSSGTRRKRSKPSSTSTSQTDAIAPI